VNTIRIGGCLRTGKPTPRLTQPFILLGRSTTGLSGWAYKVGCAHLCWMADKTVWFHMAGDAPWLATGVP